MEAVASLLRVPAGIEHAQQPGDVQRHAAGQEREPANSSQPEFVPTSSQLEEEQRAGRAALEAEPDPRGPPEAEGPLRARSLFQPHARAAHLLRAVPGREGEAEQVRAHFPAHSERL